VGDLGRVAHLGGMNRNRARQPVAVSSGVSDHTILMMQKFSEQAQ